MKVNTRLFGQIDIAEDKTITLVNGLVGFPDLKKFTLVFDAEKEKSKRTIMWFQSLDEPAFAMPVMVPNEIVEDYNPMVDSELLTPLGEVTEENLYVLVTVKVPKDIENMSINLKAPIIINTDTLLADQIIVQDDVEVRFPVYEYLQAQAGKDGE